MTKENIKYKVKLLGFLPSIIDRARVDSKIIDGCAWTIISTDQAKYTFYEAMGPTADLPTPVPIIERLHVNGGGETACIDITGKNFTSKLKVCQHFEICHFLHSLYYIHCISISLKVWFGDCEAETICRSEENMIAVVPDRKLVQPDWDPKISAADKLSVSRVTLRFPT